MGTHSPQLHPDPWSPSPCPQTFLIETRSSPHSALQKMSHHTHSSELCFPRQNPTAWGVTGTFHSPSHHSASDPTIGILDDHSNDDTGEHLLGVPHASGAGSMNSSNDVDAMIGSLFSVETRRLERLGGLPEATQAARGCSSHSGGTIQKLPSSPGSLPSLMAGKLKCSPS